MNIRNLWDYHEKHRPEVFCKKVFLKILQNSQENTCARVFFFDKVAGFSLQFY